MNDAAHHDAPECSNSIGASYKFLLSQYLLLKLDNNQKHIFIKILFHKILQI